MRIREGRNMKCTVQREPKGTARHSVVNFADTFFPSFGNLPLESNGEETIRGYRTGRENWSPRSLDFGVLSRVAESNRFQKSSYIKKILGCSSDKIYNLNETDGSDS